MKDRIKQVRKEAKITQQELADSLGLKQNTIAMYEIGRITPSDRTILDICRIYNVNEKWLRYGEGEMLTQRSKEEEIADFLTDLSVGKGTDFQRRLVSVLARMSSEEWEMIERKAIELMEDIKKDPVD